MTAGNQSVDLAVVGAGAAGLATAIFAARRYPTRSIVALDSARKLGAKILVSGGARCNVTNVRVTASDFRGGNPNIIRNILKALPVEPTVAFFREIGVTLHEEECGKLFPDSNRSQTVLDALLAEVGRRRVQLLTDHAVSQVKQAENGFEITTGAGPIFAHRVVLATGGLSLPKTGSTGGGYRIAEYFGHSLVPPTPALVPLVLEGDMHVALSGVSQDVELTVRVDGSKPVRHRGAMLWTHFGVSGPAIMDVSGLWHRAKLENRPVTIYIGFLPGESFETTDQRLRDEAAARPKAQLSTVLSGLVPARVAETTLDRLGIDGQAAMAHFSKENRRKLVHALLEWPLPVRGSRGFNYAEVTSGGVPLDEVDPATMGSRHCPGLYLVGEILDVDGRIGGFNFQWAWSSGHVAGSAPW